MPQFSVYHPPPAQKAVEASARGPKSRAVETLKKLPLFAGLLEGEYFKILSVCSSVVVPGQQVLFREGDAGDSLYVLLSGEVDIIMEGRGTIHVMEPGEVLGEICLVCDMPRTASAVTGRESVLLRVEAEALNGLLARNPRVGMVTMKNIAATLARRLKEENERQKLDLTSMTP